MRLLDLKRNDEPAALQFAADAIKAGEYKPEMAQMLMMLQDDPTDLIDRLSELEGADDE